MNSSRIALVFYRSASGAEPVREWLLGLAEDDRRAIGQDLMRVQWRWPVGMPLVRPMGDGLFEVRSSLASNRIARILFCFWTGDLYALHGFIKKTRATSPADLALARDRKQGIDNG